MINKGDFYHGATILKAVEDPRNICINFNKIGYIINSTNLAIIKYSTKSKSPWKFTFTNNDLANIVDSYSSTLHIYIILVCASDGFCALKYQETLKLLNEEPGVISVRRKFNEQYSVFGHGRQLENKISLNRWPKILFEPTEEINCKELTK